MARPSIALLPALALVTALSLTACAPATHTTAGPTKLTTTTPSDAPSSAPTPTETSIAAPPASTSTPDPNTTRSGKHTKPTPPPCDATKLTITYVPVDNTAGQAHAVLMFTNKSPAACQAYGNPFVWFSTTTGTKVGPQSKSVDGSTAAIITLQPGQNATAQLTISDADIIGSCTVVSENHMVVTPAGADNSAVISVPTMDACSNAATLTAQVEVLT